MEKVSKLIESVKIPRIEREHAVPVAISIAAATALLYSSCQLLSSNNGKKKAVKHGIKEIPVPGSAYPYIGHMMSLGELPGRKVAEWHKELGPILKLKMGRQTWITIDDPVLAHKIFVSRGVETSARPYSVYAFEHYSLKGKGIAFSTGSEWRKNRSAVLSVLAPKQIETYMSLITKESHDLVDRLIISTEKDGSTDPLKHLELNSMNVVFNVGFGRRFDSIDNPEFQALSDMVETTVKYAGLENDLANFLPFMSIFDYFKGSQAKMQSHIKTERNPLYRQLIREAIMKEGPSLVKSLDEDGHGMSEDEKIVFMSDLIGGGTDTISVTLSWNFAILCHHPEIQKKVSTEIDAFTARHGRIPTFKEREEVPYCISVIKECMRYRPTGAFGLPHATTEDVEVEGYVLPKGCTIISSMDSMHKRSDVFPQPELFIPERFMNNTRTMQSAANGKLEDRDHFIFGWGRRVCPGIYLADVEIFLAFIQVFSRCFIEPATESSLPDIEGAQNAGLTTLPLPYKVKFLRRANALI